MHSLPLPSAPSTPFPAGSDEQLVASALQGEQSAFEAIMRRHNRLLFRAARGVVSDDAEAQDVVQETWAAAFRGLQAFRRQASVKTWLTQILVRQAAWHYRKANRAHLLRQASEPVRVLPAQQRAEMRLDLGEAILALGPEHREVIVLRELQGLSYEEIASTLGVPRGTVESRLFRARRQLQDLLKDYLNEDRET